MAHQSALTGASNRIISIKAVINLTGLSKSTIYLYIKERKFPSPIKLGLRRVGWVEHEMLAWVQERIAESRVA